MPSLRPATRTTAYERCLQETAAQAGKLMLRVIRRAVHAMPQLAAAGADEAQRRALREAAGALMKSQDRICTLYQRGMQQALRGTPADAGTHTAAPGLGLVDDEETRERLSLGRLADAARAVAGAELAAFDALMCAAQGLHIVHAGRNPLRPDVHVRCLKAALDQCGARGAVRELWLAHLGDPLGFELAQLYRALGRQLRTQGVPEAEFMPPGLRSAEWAADAGMPRPPTAPLGAAA